MDGNGKPILEGAKAMADPIVCRKIMKVMILPNDYDVAINFSQKEHHHKLDRDCYHININMLASKFIFSLSIDLLTSPFCVGEGIGGG